MAIETPPGVLDDVETGAVVQRHVTSALAGERAGVCGATHLTVTQSSTPGMSVAVTSGYALVSGSTVANQGLYGFHNDATVSALAISPGDPTNPRNDLVVAQVRDASYAGADSDCRLFVVEGTPAATPADPTPPASCLTLARVRVDANESTSILNADITDLRVFTGDYRLDRVESFLSLSLHPSFTGTFGVYRQNRMVQFLCNVQYTGGGVTDTSVSLGTISSGYRPLGTVGLPAVTSADAAQRCTVDAITGVVSLPSLTISTSALLSISGMWFTTA